MRRNRSLIRYQRNPPATLLIGVVLIGLLIWVIMKKNQALQYNEERVVIERDVRGRIAAMSVHRSAH